MAICKSPAGLYFCLVYNGVELTRGTRKECMEEKQRLTSKFGEL